MTLTTHALIATLTLLIAPLRAAADCGNFPSTPGPGQRHKTYTGSYWNARYRFGVTLPTGLSAYGVYVPGGDRGMAILLSTEPRSLIYGGGEYLGERGDTALQREADDLQVWLYHDKSVSVVDEKRTESRLGALKALRVVTTFRCTQSARVFIWDFTLAATGEVLLKAELMAPADRYAADVLVFSDVLASWRDKKKGA